MFTSNDVDPLATIRKLSVTFIGITVKHGMFFTLPSSKIFIYLVPVILIYLFYKS